jgi:subtilisin family serine protease
MAIAFVAGILAWTAWGRQGGRAWLAGGRGAALAGLACVGMLVLYRFAGHPGSYGEQFFVILRDQADVSAATQIADRNQRLTYVFKTLTQHAEQTQSPLRAELDRQGVSYRPYYLVNGLEVNGGPGVRAYLERRPEVARILDSPHLRPLPAAPPAASGSDPPPNGPQWNIRAIGADRVWNELKVTGQGIVIGQSDSGVQGDHPALKDTYRGRGGQNDYNWLDPWNNTRQPTDAEGHGTHTLGSALGKGGIGVAPGAQWFACVNLARNLGNPGWYLNCMQFMLAPYPQGGDPFRDGDPTRAAHVLNDSWGCPVVEGCDAQALAPATAALRDAGIFVVASAGNDGPACHTVTDPIAIYPDVVSVGATDPDGRLAFFSSRGPVQVDGSGRTKPDIVAPGVQVLSAFPNSTYAVEDGTSMSGPHVAGVVALMWSANPKLIGNIDRTRQILLSTAKPYTGTVDFCGPAGHPNNAVGFGMVDAYAAVKAALAEK